MKVEPGTRIADRYRIEHELARGGMGAVYVAWDEKFDKRIALKIAVAAGAAGDALKARFKREAKIGDRLGQKEGFVRALDWGELDDGIRLYMAMDLVEGGEPLDLKTGGLAERLERFKAAARLVAQAHAQGVIHRDLKPANFLQAPDGSISLMDFGLGKRIGEQEDDAQPDVTGLTMTGVGMGTPRFMPPEQFDDARSVDQRADVYALGVMLFYAITAQYPYSGRTPTELMAKQQKVLAGREPAPSPRDVVSELPQTYDQACAQALLLDPEDRLRSVMELVQLIDGVAFEPTLVAMHSEEAESPPPNPTPDAVPTAAATAPPVSEVEPGQTTQVDQPPATAPAAGRVPAIGPPSRRLRTFLAATVLLALLVGLFVANVGGIRDRYFAPPSRTQELLERTAVSHRDRMARQEAFEGFERGQELEASGSVGKALSVYREVVEKYPGTDGAKDSQTRIMGLAQEPRDKAEQVRTLTASGEYERAFRLGVQLLKDYPQSQDVRALVVPLEIRVTPASARLTIDGRPPRALAPGVISVPLATPSRLRIALVDYEVHSGLFDLAHLEPDEIVYPMEVELRRGARWIVEAQDPLIWGPVLMNVDRILAASEARVHVLGRNGHLLWEFLLDEPDEDPNYAGKMAGSPLASSDWVIVVARSGWIVCLSAASGRVRWRRKYPDGLANPVLLNEHMFLVTHRDKVYAVDVTGGDTEWEYDLGGAILAGPPGLDSDSLVLLAETDGQLIGLDGSTGQRRLERKLRYRPTNTPVLVPDGSLWLTHSDDDIEYLTLHLKSGKEAARYLVSDDPDTPAHPPVYTDGVVYYSMGSALTAISARDGKLRWTADLSAKDVSSRPTIHGSHIYVPTADGVLHSLSATDGNPRWRFPTQGEIHSPAVVSGDTVYVASSDHKLYAFPD